MGREIKRVSLSFDWPLNLTWKGFCNPYNSVDCSICEGSGENPETKQLGDDWYDFANTGHRWCDNITQDEVDALIEHGRLYDFTQKFISGEGWVPIEPKPTVTAEMVNDWNKRKVGHDAINRWICVETRAKRLGIYGKCPACNGDGQIWFSQKIKELSEGWYDNERYEPPAGDGWQVWETVSEGSPITPVFATSDGLIDYLVEFGDAWDQKRGQGGWDKKNAEKFVSNGFAMSLVIEDGVMKSPRDGQL